MSATYFEMRGKDAIGFQPRSQAVLVELWQTLSVINITARRIATSHCGSSLSDCPARARVVHDGVYDVAGCSPTQRARGQASAGCLVAEEAGRLEESELAHAGLRQLSGEGLRLEEQQKSLAT